MLNNTSNPCVYYTLLGGGAHAAIPEPQVRDPAPHIRGAHRVGLRLGERK